nr:MAG TPA: hypothetical protein [Caudoviricetes sp.]
MIRSILIFSPPFDTLFRITCLHITLFRNICQYVFS